MVIIMNNIEKLQQIINKSDNIVFFSGAGISTLSGLKDFRSKDGLYSETFAYPPEEILSHEFFLKNPEYFYKFYREKLNPLNYKPNIIHYYLTGLETSGKLKAIITQNIDNFHLLAGNKNVLELHGNIMRNYCQKCHKFYDGQYVFKSQGIPKCACGGIIKPDVVLYGESLNEDILNKSINSISNCDTLIVAGTSLTVYPAAGLIRFFHGSNLVIINNNITDYDQIATLVINDDLKNVFSKLHI
jgi:NAD-dependent deacetylase